MCGVLKITRYTSRCTIFFFATLEVKDALTISNYDVQLAKCLELLVAFRSVGSLLEVVVVVGKA